MYYNSSIDISNQTSPFTGFHITYKIPKTFAYSILFLISIFGNSFIVWTIYKDNRLKASINYLVANMAVSDIITTVVVVPIRIVHISFVDYRWLVHGDVGLVLCKLWGALFNIPVVVSMYSCVFIAIDRYCAVARPFDKGFRKSTVVKRIIPGLWIFAIPVSSLIFKDMVIVKRHIYKYCEFDYKHGIIYRYVNLGLLVGVPVPIAAIIYTMIVYKLNHQKIPGQKTSLIIKQRIEQNKNVLKMSIVIVASLYIPWFCYSTFEIIYMNGKLKGLSEQAQSNIFFAAYFIVQLLFAQNFFIYLVFNDIYRKNFKSMMLRWFGACCKVSRKSDKNVVAM